MSERGFLSRMERNDRAGRRWPGPKVTFLSVETAPLRYPVMVQVMDGGARYCLPFPCVRLAGGWINTLNGRLLAVAVVGWRHGESLGFQ